MSETRVTPLMFEILNESPSIRVKASTMIDRPSSHEPSEIKVSFIWVSGVRCQVSGAGCQLRPCRHLTPDTRHLSPTSVSAPAEERVESPTSLASRKVWPDSSRMVHLQC